MAIKEEGLNKKNREKEMTIKEVYQKYKHFNTILSAFPRPDIDGSPVILKDIILWECWNTIKKEVEGRRKKRLDKKSRK